MSGDSACHMTYAFLVLHRKHVVNVYRVPTRAWPPSVAMLSSGKEL